VSDISKLIDEVVKLGLAPLLKERGFRKSSRDFQRRVDENWQIVNVQASQGNVGTAGKFTLNLGVYLPLVSKTRPILSPGFLFRRSTTVRLEHESVRSCRSAQTFGGRLILWPISMGSRGTWRQQ